MTQHHTADGRPSPELTVSEEPAELGVVDAKLPGLNEHESAILEFESDWRRHSGAKEEAIRDTFGFSGARYYQLLGVLIDSPAAIEADPMLVKRLHRMRADRASGRSTRTAPPSH